MNVSIISCHGYNSYYIVSGQFIYCHTIVIVEEVMEGMGQSMNHSW